MSSRPTQQRVPEKKKRRIAIPPTTRLGRWAVGLAAASLVLVPVWTILSAGAAIGFACALAGGIVALIAIFRRGERAITVFAALLPFPFLFVIVFVLAELIVGHD